MCNIVYVTMKHVWYIVVKIHSFHNFSWQIMHLHLMVVFFQAINSCYISLKQLIFEALHLCKKHKLQVKLADLLTTVEKVLISPLSFMVIICLYICAWPIGNILLCNHIIILYMVEGTMISSIQTFHRYTSTTCPCLTLSVCVCVLQCTCTVLMYMLYVFTYIYIDWFILECSVSFVFTILYDLDQWSSLLLLVLCL